MQRRWIAVFTILVIATIIISGCSSSPASSSPVTPAASPGVTTPLPLTPAMTARDSLNLVVDALSSGAMLPDSYSCKGAGESPGLSWGGVPAGTKSLVLILEDPDAPAGTFTHWIVYNIPPENGSFAPAQTNAKVLENGAQQGDTTAGSRGYYPPCPPVGTTHRYIFRLYALDMEIAMPTADRNAIDGALSGHTIAQVDVSTKFSR